MEFNPYHLRYSRNMWYFLGKSSVDGQTYAAKSSSIKNVQLAGGSFIGKTPFDLHGCLGRAWSMLPEGRTYNIKLRFAPDIADDVTAVRWHKTQTAHYEDDGSAVVEFRVDGLNEITWWILGYGNGVEVLTPRVLRRKIIQIVQRMANPHKPASAGRRGSLL
jgi:predicted DNA-binding transcriptional regulator YafY